MKLTIKKDGEPFYEAEVSAFAVGFFWMAGAVFFVGLLINGVRVISWIIGLF
jgi:hypothetical protein